MDIATQNISDLTVTQAMATKPATPTPSANIDKTASDFEGMFFSQMFQPMFDSISVDPNFGGGHGEEVMRSFMTQEFGKLAAKAGGFGMATAIKNAMIHMQAVANAAKATPAQAAASYNKGA